MLWQDWQNLNVFLQRGDGAGCNFDELAGQPSIMPLPAISDVRRHRHQLHPGGRTRIRAGQLLRASCATTTRASSVAPAPNTNNDPNTDVDQMLFMRSVGFGPRGSRAAVELTLGAAAMPAVVVEGNLEVKGNPTVTGPAGSIHANGTLELSGNPCTHVYYASVAGTTESGNVQGGTGCTAAGVDSRPFSPRINIPRLSPYAVAQQAVRPQAFQVRTLLRKDSTDGTDASCSNNNGCAFLGLPVACWSPTAIPSGWSYQNNGKTWRTQGQTAGRHVLHRRQCRHHRQHRRCRRR